MSKITYTNKVAINENAEIPDINKVTDSDMNEIKSVVNNNDDELITINNKITKLETRPYQIRKQSSIITWSGTNSWDSMPYPDIVDTNGDFSSWSYDTTESTITVGNNASKIKIISDISFHSETAGDIWLMSALYKNSTQLKKVIGSANSNINGWCTNHLEYIFDVEEGDIISVKIRKEPSGTVSLNPLINPTFGDGSCNTLIIEILKD